MDTDKVTLKLDPQEAWLVRAILLKRVDEMKEDPRFQEGSAWGDVTAAKRIANTLALKVERLERLNALLEKVCVKCDAPIDRPALAPWEQERCADCGED